VFLEAGAPQRRVTAAAIVQILAKRCRFAGTPFDQSGKRHRRRAAKLLEDPP
jgi:hypothetical protein